MMKAQQIWQCGCYALPLDRPLVMGIVNVTPDSFSDGGKWISRDKAIEHALELKAQGADILDIGGESTRPGSLSVSLEEELDRVIPIVQALKEEGIPLSVDTNKSEVMSEALSAGATIINDVWALRKEGAEAVVAESDCGICLMHMQNDPKTMQIAPTYKDFLNEVKGFLKERAEKLESLGVARDRICIDPGFGFGKTVSQNFELLHKADEFVDMGYAVLYGVSRKSSLGVVAGINKAGERLIPSVVAAVLAAERGAQILRVHDVKETVEALKILQATQHFEDL